MDENISKCITTSKESQMRIAILKKLLILSYMVKQQEQETELRGSKATKEPIYEFCQLQKYLAFTKEHKEWTMKNWNHVLWSDKSKFNMVVLNSQISNACLVPLSMVNKT